MTSVGVEVSEVGFKRGARLKWSGMEVAPWFGRAGSSGIDGAPCGPDGSEGAKHDAAPLHASAAQPESSPRRGIDVLPLVRHSMMCTGDVLMQHYAHQGRRIYRQEPWRMFCSTRPMSALVTLYWVRALLFVLGVWVLLRDGEGLFRLKWRDAIPRASMIRARKMRFRAVALRTGAKEWDAPVTPQFGLLMGDCKLDLSGANVTNTRDSSTLHFATEVEFDGWWMLTGAGDPQLDPVVFDIQSSLDDSTWNHVAAPWNGDRCMGHASASTLAQHDVSLVHQYSKVVPEERKAEMIFSFTSMSCLWPYYVLCLAYFVLGVSFLSAPFAAIGLKWHEAPIRFMATFSVLSGILQCCSVGYLIADRRNLPYGPLEASSQSYMCEALMVLIHPLFLLALAVVRVSCPASLCRKNRASQSHGSLNTASIKFVIFSANLDLL